MRKKFAIIVFFAITCPSALVRAQTSPDLDGGIRPYASLADGGIDKVDLLSGNLLLDIPLYSLPQRGSMKFSFSLRYSGKNAWRAEQPPSNPNGPPTNPTAWYWKFQSSGVVPVRDQLIRHTADEFASGTQSNTYIILDRLLTSDGEIHQVGPFSNGTTNNAGQYLAGSQPGITIDASGISLLANGTVITPDGIQYRIPEYFDNAKAAVFNGQVLSGVTIFSDTQQGAISDVSGNTITTIAGGWQDTLGRTIPGSTAQSGEEMQTGLPFGDNYGWFTEYLFPGVVTTNYSNCPAGTSHAREWDVPGPGGDTEAFFFCFSLFSVQSNFPTSTSYITATYTNESTTVELLSAVILPNLTSYGFAYDSWGELQTLTLPTGGTISYQWSSGSPCMEFDYSIPDIVNSVPGTGRFVTSRIVNANDGTGTKTWTYSYPIRSGPTNSNQSTAQTIVTDPAGNDTEDDFSLPSTLSGLTCSLNETTVKEYSGSRTSGSLLRTTATQYAGAWNPFAEYGVATTSGEGVTSYDSESGTMANNVPTQVTTTWANGLQAQKNFVYDSGASFDFTYIINCCNSASVPLTYGRVTSESVTDYGSGSPGSVLATTQTSYLWQSNSGAAYLAANFLNLPCLVSTYGSGSIPQQSGCTPPSVQSNLASQTVYGYDENNGSPQGVYGNQTSQTHWLSSGSNPKSQAVYDSQGMPTKKIDPNGNTTTTTYDSTGAFPKQIQYPTTNGIQHIDQFVYDPNIGKMTSHTDENSKTATYGYDSMRRLTSVTYPDNGYESYTYNDSTPTPSVTYKRALNSNQNYVKVSISDGLGRAIHGQVTSDPAGTVFTDTTYDNAGRVQSISNPYRTTSDPTYGITSYLYDALNRKLDQCQPGNSSTPSTTCIPQNVYQSWTYSGNTVSFKDENGNQWQQASDGLGRLTNVVEPGSLVTNYIYDALSNLLKVNQLGNASNGDSPRTRTFNYDSLSRLLCASNPESSTAACPMVNTGAYAAGTTGYGYDANGNVTSKTDARGVVINFAYDALNRLYAKTYTNAPAGTLSSCYQFDTATNGIDRLAAEWTQTGSCSSTPPSTPPAVYQSLRTYGAYDAMGRALTELQCAAGYCTTTSVPSQPAANCATLSSATGLQYCFDLAGNLLAYSNGLTTQAAGLYPQHALLFGQTFDAAGRLNSVGSSWSDSTHPSPLFSAPTYTPFNALSSWLLGTQLTTTRTYDNRLRVMGQSSAQ
jgi:YD repeat-containing protein